MEGIDLDIKRFSKGMDSRGGWQFNKGLLEVISRRWVKYKEIKISGRMDSKLQWRNKMEEEE